ncbi:MAG TPA: prepilin-type N-terminal cleavage/methylation domain-containing protein [Steroidobacteraceae bacterium]|nr:prepilin-type N-terminal cleavage/methylation domain-containing protein [Steroidobacteraceae bacterium]
MRRPLLRGFTLLELLCAMALGVLIVGAALDLFAGGARALAAGEESSQLSEQARAALASMELDLQQAGFLGLTRQGADFRLLQQGDESTALPATALRQGSTPVAAFGTAVQACGDNFALDLSLPVQAADDHYALGPHLKPACAARGGGAVAGTDTLTIRRAAAVTTSPAAGRVQLLIDRLDATRRFVFADGMLPAGSSLQPDLLEVHDLVLVAYYVAHDSDGHPGLPALRVKTLTSVSGTPAFTDTEIMTGIQDLQVQLLVAGGWVTPEALPTDATVRAVRLTLTARAQDAPGSEPRLLTWTRTVGIRNAL